MSEDSTPDSDLLRRYRTSGCGDAFRALVERHAGMVCAAAQRILGHDLWAQDVMQVVFVDFARKGRALPDGIVPGAWLYRAACRHALNRQRTETRQRRRAEAHAAMTEPSTADETWAAMAPHVDAAMGSLSNADRTALVLRFLENQPLSEVGRALGTNDDAAQKRVSRALTKLRSILQKRGVVLSATILGSQAMRQSVQAAEPMVKCESLAAAALSAGGGPASLWTAVVCNARAALIAACISTLAGGAVWHSIRKEQAARAPVSVSSSASASPRANGRPARVASGGNALLSSLREPATAPEALEMMLAILDLPDNHHRSLLVNWIGQQDLLQKLPLGELVALMEQCENLEVMDMWGSQVLRQCALFQDSAIASKASVRWRGISRGTAGECFADWARKDSKAAFDWLFAERIALEALHPESPVPVWQGFVSQAVSEALSARGTVSVPRTTEMLQLIPEPQRTALLQSGLKLVDMGYVHEAESRLSADLLEIAKIPDPAVRTCLERAVVLAFTEERAKRSPNPDEITGQIDRVLSRGSSIQISPEAVMPHGNLNQTLAGRMLESASPEKKASVLPDLVRHWLRKYYGHDHRGVNDWLSSYPADTPGLDQARLLMTKGKPNGPHRLFDSRLPVSDPAYHDQAVAGWLQQSLENYSGQDLRELYLASEAARNWSPKLRSRVEEIMSATER